jgi:hypothetical protein
MRYGRRMTRKTAILLTFDEPDNILFESLLETVGTITIYASLRSPIHEVKFMTCISSIKQSQAANFTDRASQK